MRSIRQFVVMLLPVLVVACTQLKDDPPEEANKKKEESHVGKMTREILDLKVVQKEHPDWVEIDPNFKAEIDPLATSLSASQSIPWDMAKMTFQRNCVEQFKALNDGIPPYSVAKNFVERESRGLPARRPYEHYAYDETDGRLLIVLDKEHRNRIYKEKGIPIPKD